MLSAGQLDQRVTLQQPVASQGPAGEEVITWTDLATVWAAVLPLKGRELLAADQMQGELDTRIHIRWSSAVDAVTPKWRITHRGRVYNVVSVAQVAFARDQIELMCKSGANDG